MAWIYLAESEDLPWRWDHGCGRSPIVKMTDTLRPCCCPVWLTANCHRRRSGMTCEVSAEILCDGQEQSTSYMEDSPARTSVLRDLEVAWTETAVVFFMNSPDYVAIFDQNSYSWKTSQLSLFEDSTEFYWPSMRSGMILDGRLYLPANLALHTCGKDGGYLPTPTARDFKSPGLSRSRIANEDERRGIPLSVWFKQTYGINLHPSFVEWMMGYPSKHTALEDWAIQWYRTKLGRRSNSYQD